MAADEADEQAFLDSLEREDKEFAKDEEIDRILRAFPLNSYEVLDLLPGAPPSDIKLVFRKKSLLIHPDKTKNKRAPDAFDRLKKAEAALSDDKQREKLDEAIADARHLLIRQNKWTVDSPELKEEQFLKVDLPDKTREVLKDNIERLKRQREALLREEGRQQRKEDEEIAERKRKRDEAEEWEANRDNRINNWRQFSKGLKSDGAGKKTKKTKKLKVLG